MIPPPDDELTAREEMLAEARTELSWSRSGLALLAAFAILGRRVWANGDISEDALTVTLMAVAALAWAFGVLRSRARGDADGPRRPIDLLAVTAGTVTLAVAGLVVAVFA